MMNVLSINARGIGGAKKRKWIKNLCFQQGVSFLGVQETLMTQVKLFHLKSMWGNYQFDFACSTAQGHSGGIVLLWDTAVFIKSNIHCGVNYVIVEGIWSGIIDICYFINVYALQDVEARKQLWEDITRYLSDKSGHFILFGDFNEVRFESERFGSLFNSQGAANFNAFINQIGLVDLNIGGRNFTWMNKMGTKMSKLYRFLLSESEFCSTTLFRLFHSWLEIEEFNDVVVDSYNSFQNAHGSALVNFKNKLKHIKSSCRAWHKDFKEKKKARHKVLCSSIGEVERKIDENCASQDEVVQRLVFRIWNG
ncbi:RNA-directed DNA polymerase, eukaryota, reverse transcriptase zinc-binding domain protein [Tanacetum coccineum]